MNTVPVGVPPVGSTGVGMFTTSGLIVTGALFAPGTRYSVDRPALLSEIQNGLPVLSEMPHALTRFGSVTAAAPGRSDTRLVCRTVPPELTLRRRRLGGHSDQGQGAGRDQRGRGDD